LSEIYDYIKQHSPQNAKLVLRRLLDETASLSLFPYRYKVYQLRRHLSMTVRAMPVQRHVAYYRISEQAKTVEIISIRHGRRRRIRF
jgi:plasmid stabilization system protein ParE